MTTTPCEVCETAPATTTVYIWPPTHLIGDPVLSGRVCRFCAGVCEHRAMLNGDGFTMTRDEDR